MQPEAAPSLQPAQVVVEDEATGADGAAGAPGPLRIAERAWAAGLGWYTQRAVSVPDEDLDELILQLQRARALRRTRAPAPGRGAAGVILPFRRRPPRAPDAAPAG